jgi:hypothetical protein
MTTHCQLVSRLRMSGGVEPFSLFTFVACTGTSVETLGLMLVGVETL